MCPVSVYPCPALATPRCHAPACCKCAAAQGRGPGARAAKTWQAAGPLAPCWMSVRPPACLPACLLTSGCPPTRPPVVLLLLLLSPPPQEAPHPAAGPHQRRQDQPRGVPGGADGPPLPAHQQPRAHGPAGESGARARARARVCACLPPTALGVPRAHGPGGICPRHACTHCARAVLALLLSYFASAPHTPPGPTPPSPRHAPAPPQEYLGSYVSDASGRLVFREGPLVQAVRRGWWVVLDELNLAPTEVLEALNR